MLRPYQKTAIDNLRVALRTNRTALLQAPTGTGKTVQVAAITSAAEKNNFRVWFIVPRRELMNQASKHFVKWNIPHNMIAPGREESRAFKTHIVSKDTLIRRWEKIKNWPHLIVIDEAHINYKFQIELLSRIPDYTKIIGISATPERLDGLGLNDIYNTLIMSESIPEFTAGGYLSPLRYFSPPIEGLENLHRKGTEVDADELDELLKRKFVYGEAVGHYSKWGKGKPALVFTRTVKAAYEVADRFCDKGFRFFCIEGKMKGSERKRLINALTDGSIDGLVSCDLLTYGFDCPRVEYGASLRPTMSRALYFQMVGRILRPYENKHTGYKKTEALFFDHVNLLSEHYDPANPGIPLFYLNNIEWNFGGDKKRKRLKKPDIMRQCPYLDYMYCEKKSCKGCKLLPQGQFDFQAGQEQKIIDVQLKEAEKPIAIKYRPYEEQRKYIDNINGQIAEYVEAFESEGKILPGPVGELIKIAKRLNRAVMWVYFVLIEKTYSPEMRQQGLINIPLLHEIARQEGYKPGWVWYKKKELEKRRGA